MGEAFRSVAALLLPADPAVAGEVVEADESWRVGPSPAPVVVWGRESLPSGTGLRTALPMAMARERALLRARRAGDGSTVRISPFPPPVLRAGSVRNRLRSFALGGAVVERSTGPAPRRVVDAVLEDAGCELASGWRPGSGGSLLARVRRADGARGVLRVGRPGAPSDPARGAGALVRLGGLEQAAIPSVLARGTSAGASWSVESLLPGRRPGRLTRPLAEACVGLCAALPISDQPPAAHREDLATLATAFPSFARRFDGVRARIDEATDFGPSVLRHGDLWPGNLLVRRGRLTGVLDWDAWHPRGVPGADLLHLVAADLASRNRADLGTVWRHRPWEGEAFRGLSARLWSRLRLRPDPAYLTAIGWAWWAAHAAASISRLPRLAADRRWLEGNVHRVLEADRPLSSSGGEERPA